MDAFPPLLSSAQTALQNGFSRLNSAANKIVGSSLADPSDPPTASSSPPTSTDPFLGGILDLTSARQDITTGVLLLDTYNRTMNDLLQTADPNRPYAQQTYGSFSTYG